MSPEESLDELTEEVEELARQMSAPDLARALEERAHNLEVASPGRAALLTHAAERWELAGDLERARLDYEEAVADGGRCFLDPRGELAGLLYKIGDEARAEELVAELERDARQGRLHDVDYAQVGEALEALGRLDQALWWFEAGLEEQADAPDITCLNGRWRVRRAKQLPIDRLDLAVEAYRQVSFAELAGYRDEGRAGAEADPVLAVVFWREAEHAQVLDRWPHLAADYGANHLEHRRLVESRLRQLAETHERVVIAAAQLDDYVAFAAERHHEAGVSSLRAMYAAHLVHLGRTLPWPPEPDEPCWCGSSRAYVTCCGAPGFAAP